jgi:hypothetical protein
LAVAVSVLAVVSISLAPLALDARYRGAFREGPPGVL